MTMNDWRADLRLELENLVDAAVVAGARQQDVYADDVSEQVIEEPSNDWPAADKG
jgi:hypothetical protein